MRGRKNNQVADFLSAFNGTLGTVNQVAQDFELSKIAGEKPVESTGFTAEQGAQLEAAAKTGQYEIGYDQEKKAYTVTPKNAPDMVGTIAQQGVTDFMGQRTAGSMSEGQVNTARQRAMAGVISKTDPMQGARLMREVTQGERDDKRFGWESARNEREAKLGQEQDADRELARQIDGEVGTWFKGRLTNPDGTERAPTMDDQLASSQYRAARLMASGKAEKAGEVLKDFNAQSLVKIQLEGAQRNEAIGKTAAALSAGDLSAVKDFYNQYIPDGARVTGVERSKDGGITINRETLDGRPMAPTTMKDTGQLLSALTTFKDPLALYNWSQNELKNTLAVNADKRADRADGRAGAAESRAKSGADEAKTEKTEKAKAAVELYKQNNPGATAADLEAVRRGIIEASPKAEGFNAEYKPDAIGSGGSLIQADKRGNATITKLDGKGNPIKTTSVAPPSKAAAAQAAAKPPDQKTAHSQAADAVARGADKAKINERLKQMGYAALP